jgi:DNA/RNA endonuclease G (NUC1)
VIDRHRNEAIHQIERVVFPVMRLSVFVAQKLNRASGADADEKRKDRFFEDARLPRAERATLEDYKNSCLSRGHLPPVTCQTKERWRRVFRLQT